MNKTLFLTLTVVITLSAAARAATSTDKLIEALIEVESHGNNRAIGDRHLAQKAYGCLQIRKPCVDDVNQRLGTKYKAEEMLGNRSLSKFVCGEYLKKYATRKQLGREPTSEDLARIWNGGPSGWKRDSTKVYWIKVQQALERQSQLAVR